jgi:ABC-type nitrate/sulfonate/bicarbonate transport system substrate-binding protein
MTLSRRHALLAGAATGLAAVSPSARAQGLRALTLQAAWINDAEFMGYYVAMEKGWYQAEGLDLKYLPGGPDVIPEASVLSRKADVALSTVETVINAVTTQRAPLVIIGAQYQKNPIGIVSLASKPIRTPADMIGKTIAVPPVNRLTVEAMLKLNGIDKSRVRIVPYAYDPTPLLKGEIEEYRDNYFAGYTLYAFLRSYPPGAPRYRSALATYEKNARAGSKDPVGYFASSFADGKDGRPKTFDEVSM